LGGEGAGEEGGAFLHAAEAEAVGVDVVFGVAGAVVGDREGDGSGFSVESDVDVGCVGVFEHVGEGFLGDAVEGGFVFWGEAGGLRQRGLEGDREVWVAGGLGEAFEGGKESEVVEEGGAEFVGEAADVVECLADEMAERLEGFGADLGFEWFDDAVYTWLHQDLGLFLLPTLTLVMLVVERFLAPRLARVIGLATITGASIAFIGAVVWVFFDTSLHRPGYVLATIGLVVIGSGLLATLWWGALKPLLTDRPTWRATATPGP